VIEGLEVSDFTGFVSVRSQLGDGVSAKTVGIVKTDALPELTNGSISRIGLTVTNTFALCLLFFVCPKSVRADLAAQKAHDFPLFVNLLEHLLRAGFFNNRTVCIKSMYRA